MPYEYMYVSEKNGGPEEIEGFMKIMIKYGMQ